MQGSEENCSEEYMSDWLKNISPVSMPIRQRIMTLNGNADVGTVNAIIKNLAEGEKGDRT